jgi:hypothetical protein
MSALRRSVALAFLVTAPAAFGAEVNPSVVKPADLKPLGTLDPRFQSYNVEMVEVTGGMFWRSYEEMAAAQKEPQTAAAGASAKKAEGGGSDYDKVKAALAPLDLSNARLRRLTAALGPAYVRVSGNEANATYFHDADTPPPSEPPKGYRAVLTRAQWKGLVEFAQATNAKIMTSFAVSEGARDAKGEWNPEQARSLIRYTQSIGGEIAAAQLINEPNMAPAGSANTPPGYDAGQIVRDMVAFRKLAKSLAPEMLIVGPGAGSEGINLVPQELIPSEAFFKAKPSPEFDVFSYHGYGASSARCTAPDRVNTSAEHALSEEWLARVDVIHTHFRSLRDRYQPGKRMWVTETAESSCGGNPWAKAFLDTFRYLDQLGRQAHNGVSVVMHNTLAVSDYGLIDREKMEPRPNYWGALMWRRLMGPTVLESRVPARAGLHVYAHCLPGQSGGVTVLAINNSRDRKDFLEVPIASQRYTLTANRLEDEQVQLNGRMLKVAANGELPQLEGQPAPAGRVEFAPLTITFLAMPDAGNKACR